MSLWPYMRPPSACLSIANLHVSHYQIQAEYHFYCINRVQDVLSSQAAQRRGCVHSSCAAISLTRSEGVPYLPHFLQEQIRARAGQSPLMWGTGLGSSDGRYLERYCQPSPSKSTPGTENGVKHGHVVARSGSQDGCWFYSNFQLLLQGRNNLKS